MDGNVFFAQTSLYYLVSQLKKCFFLFLSVSFLKNIYFVSVFGIGSKKNNVSFSFCKIIFCMYKSSPSIRKKMTILFFVYFGTHNNKIHTIYKKNHCFCYDLFHVVVLLLLAKRQQQKWIFST
jgi:hypothetical protein